MKNNSKQLRKLNIDGEIFYFKIKNSGFGGKSIFNNLKKPILVEELKNLETFPECWSSEIVKFIKEHYVKR